VWYFYDRAGCIFGDRLAAHRRKIYFLTQILCLDQITDISLVFSKRNCSGSQLAYCNKQNVMGLYRDQGWLMTAGDCQRPMQVQLRSQVLIDYHHQRPLTRPTVNNHIILKSSSWCTLLD